MKPSDETRDSLAENAADLQRAREDAALFDRLSNARSEIARLQKAGSALTATLSKQLDQEAAAEKKAADARFRNLSVATTYPNSLRPSGLLAARFAIRWEGPSWNYQTRETEYREFSADGFPALPNDVYAYLMEHRPDVIPSIIMDLAPGDPQAAMDRYFSARRRGYC